MTFLVPDSWLLKLRDWVQSQPEALASEEVMSHTTSSIAGPSRTRFEVAQFESHPISLRDFPWFFVLVLRVSSTRTRTRRYGNEYEYEYHFIEYEYGAEPRVRNFKTGASGWYFDRI